MRLYRITTHFYGKDLDEAAQLGYLLADNDTEVFNHINGKFKYDEWPESVDMDEDQIITAQGDHDSEYMGEFYDQKFGWDDLGEVSDEDVATLRRLGVVK